VTRLVDAAPDYAMDQRLVVMSGGKLQEEDYQRAAVGRRAGCHEPATNRSVRRMQRRGVRRRDTP
jgi:hypothetical protein